MTKLKEILEKICINHKFLSQGQSLSDTYSFIEVSDLLRPHFNNDKEIVCV